MSLHANYISMAHISMTQVEMLRKGNDSRYNFKIIRNVINYSNFKFVILSSFNIDRLSCWYSIFTKIGTFYDCRVDFKSQSQTLIKNNVLEKGQMSATVKIKTCKSNRHH